MAIAALDAPQCKEVDTTDCCLVSSGCSPAAGKNRPGCDEYHIGRSSLLRSVGAPGMPLVIPLMWGQIEKA